MSDGPESSTPPPPQFAPDEELCGNCKLWRAHSVDAAKGWVGNCRVQPHRGLFPPTAPLCDAFVSRYEKTVTTVLPEGTTRAKVLKNIKPMVRSASGAVKSAPTGPTLVSRIDPSTPIDLEGLEGLTMTRQELMELFLEASGLADVPLAQKWEGGVVKMVPADASLQPKEVPIDSLFHKIVMIRDRLRTLEQKINAHSKLTDAEKVEMQQYVTRCYGSLTTFNVLFREKNDFFVGQKGDE